MIKDARSHGFFYYDFMKGSLTNSYKAKFAGKATLMFNAKAVKKSWLNIVHLLKWKLSIFLI